MVQCPFCHYSNEDGALFCEQCKSDLAGVAVAAEAVPMAAEAIPVEAEPMVAEAVPVEAMPVEAMPVEAMPVEAMPVEAMPVEATPVEATPFSPEALSLEPAAPPPPPEAVAPPPPPPAPEQAPAAPAGPAAPAAPAVSLAGKEPKLLVQRGTKPKVEYPIYEGQNFIGRADEKPVDIDLEDQEPPDRVWSSRQHACIFFENGELSIEDLNSSNGTFVNRARIYPGQKKVLNVSDVIQIGTVQLKVVV
ncbi:MAG TPA: FHA domain-containing protein [Gemmataceae bacterium]|nr:FHA domain-containing protein [Gemmataceae bacterium]